MPDLSGHSIGRYHLITQLGEGGMATVYKAYDTRLEREVAIKIIRRAAFPLEMMEGVLKRFEREAKSLARMSNPNIVKVYDFGDYEGSPYLVLEYLPGGTLKKLLGKPLPWQDSLRLLLPIVRGVEYAHQRGIIHRDIKPANILITENGEPMLSDFGIAKILDTGSGNTALTGSGMAIGTPEYMAPEQWAGATSSKSDIYSLGIVLYEMITGRKPYIADTPAAILLKQATEPLPAPRNFVPGLPEEVEFLLVKALAREPENRYPTAEALISAMESLLTNQPALAQPPALDITRQEFPPSPTKPNLMDGGQTILPTLESVTAKQPAPSRLETTRPGARPKIKGIQIVGLLGLLFVAVFTGYLLFPKKQEAPTTPTEPAATVITASIISTQAQEPLSCDLYRFLADVSIPDGTILAPNTTFTKTWRIKNVGACSWDSSYTLVFKNGEQMGNQTTHPMPTTVNPGDTIDISIELTSPPTAGVYRGYWALRNPAGVLIKLDNDLDAVFVEIRVDTSTPTAPSQSESLPVEIVDNQGVTMRLVPSGEFTMGANADDAWAKCKQLIPECARPQFLLEEPAHVVYLDQFYMDKFEVTNAIYRTCVQAGNCQPPTSLSSGIGNQLRANYYNDPIYNDFPVINVTWSMAKTYCEWRGARLPNESEWEKAARGTDGRFLPWGTDVVNRTLSNYGNPGGDTTSVGTYESGQSPYGIYDLAGNVSEWVADWYEAYPGQNPFASTNFHQKYRVTRGGNWNSNEIGILTIDRGWGDPSQGSIRTGFRCAKSVHEYNEAQVRYVIVDAQLGDVIDYYRQFSEQPNIAEAIRRWDTGIRAVNTDKFERIVNGNSGWQVVYAGTTQPINGMDVILSK